MNRTVIAISMLCGLLTGVVVYVARQYLGVGEPETVAIATAVALLPVARALRAKQAPTLPFLAGAVSGLTLVLAIEVATGQSNDPQWALLPAWWLGAALALVFGQDEIQMESGGDCLRCGYLLTGNRSRTCPECGWVVGRRIAVPLRQRLRGELPRQLGSFAVAVIISAMLYTAAYNLSARYVPEWASARELPDADHLAEVTMHSYVLVLRGQIALHDQQYPRAPFNPARGWSQLLQGYIREAPGNPLAAGRTGISVGRDPDPAAGWAWAPDANNSGVTVRPRDEAGSVLDADSGGEGY